MKSLDCKAFSYVVGKYQSGKFLEGVEVIARNYQNLFPFTHFSKSPKWLLL